MASGDDIRTPALLEIERKAKADHALKVSKATLAVEEVLLAHDLTWGDWGDIIDTLNARTQDVYGKMKVKQIKELYG